MKILNPTTELSGTYRCKVSSFVDEDFMQRRMIVYCKYRRTFIHATTVMYRKGLTFRGNFCSRLRHKTFGGNFFLLHPPRSSSYFRSTWVQPVQPEFPNSLSAKEARRQWWQLRKTVQKSVQILFLFIFCTPLYPWKMNWCSRM